MSFSFLKIFPVSAMMKASPFSHRLSTETPAIAAPTTVFRASAGQEIRDEIMLSQSVCTCVILQIKWVGHEMSEKSTTLPKGQVTP